MMLGYVFDHSEVVAPFVASQIPARRGRGFGPCATVGVVEGGLLIAGVVYHDYDPSAEAVEISAAALPGQFWATRPTLRCVLAHPFLQLGCQMVSSRVAAEDERLLYMLLRFGYRLLPVPRMLGRDRDGVLATLTFEDWRDNKFNKRLWRDAGLPLSEAA